MENLQHLIFQALVISAVFLILWQIKCADHLDKLRQHNNDFWFRVRRTAMFLKMLGMCWAVIYAWGNQWAPWPPMLGFMVAFNLYLVSEIFILRADIVRLERLKMLSGRDAARG